MARPRRDDGGPRGEAGPPGDDRFIFGLNPVLETLRAEPGRIERLYVQEGAVNPRLAGELFQRAGKAGLRLEQVPRERLAGLARGGVHQGVVAELKTYSYAAAIDLVDQAQARGQVPLLVVLDGIQDPQNLGAIIRSAHAFGAHGVVVGKDRSAGVTGATAKAAAGALAYLPVARETNISRTLEALKEAGLWVAGAAMEGSTDLEAARLDGPLALVIGAEGAGLREGVKGHCDLLVRIPMAAAPGPSGLAAVGSLNASVSAGILLHEVARQRRKAAKG